MLRRQGIKLNNPEEVESFIFLNKTLFKSSEESKIRTISQSVKTIFHEIGHSFSKFSGANAQDYKLVYGLYNLSTQDPSLSYQSIRDAHKSALAYHAFEEARADSIAYSLMSRTSIPRGEFELGGYSDISAGFHSAYNQEYYEPMVEDLMREVSTREIASGIPEEAAEKILSNQIATSTQEALIETHAIYHSNLAVPGEYAQRMEALQQDNILRQVDYLSGRPNAETNILKYKEAMLEATKNNSVGINISAEIGARSPMPTIAASRNAAAVDHLKSSSFALDRTGEFLAQSNLVKPSLLPAMGEESISTASAIIESSASAAPEVIETALESGVKRLSKGGLKMFGSAAKKTSSRIIERNGNRS